MKHILTQILNALCVYSVGYNDGTLGFDLFVDGVAAASSDETDDTQKQE